MRPRFVMLPLLCLPVMLHAQVGKFPPDSLVNTKVIPHSTPVPQVIGAMRNITIGLGVRCPFCHVGEEGKGLETFDFPSDKKRTKLVARQMMRMVADINKRLDTIPERPSVGVEVTCRTCHRGVSRPMPLYQVIQEAAKAGGADSAVRTYAALREKFMDRDAYDFGESSLNVAAFRLAREDKHFDDALILLATNEKNFPGSSGLAVFRGNILLMKGDSSGAADAFREAIKRDSTNGEARGRLRDLGRG
ncbi:MAG: c-type cytochrome [Gemmatimonadota bacterium]